LRRVSFTAAANRDLRAILRYISRESGSRIVARRFTDGIVKKCAHLASLPGTLGRPRPELRADLRSFPFRGYVIFFRYRDDVLEVVSVLEGHRDTVAYFKDDES
jgi:toxin ParE1/3/4